MASKAKKWATIISFTASRIFFLLIFCQIPLFRFPCRIGTCTTPIELTSSQLIASEVIPVGVAKALLYPGAIAKAILNNKPIPTYNNLLHLYNLQNSKQTPASTDLQHIEVLVGSYLAVAGSVIGLFKSRRMGLFGILLLIWGLCRDPYFLGKNAAIKDHKKATSVYYPTMSIAVISAFFSIRKDASKIISCFNCTYSKAKYK